MREGQTACRRILPPARTTGPTPAQDAERRRQRLEIKKQHEDVQRESIEGGRGKGAGRPNLSGRGPSLCPLPTADNKEILCSVNSNRLDEAIKKADNSLENGEERGGVGRRSRLRGGAFERLFPSTPRAAGGLKPKDASAHAQLFANLAECGYEAANKLATQQAVSA